MGSFLNSGNGEFLLDRNSGWYIDMSGIIRLTNARINKGGMRYLCITRPKRFGKSLTAHMLKAYYDCSVDSEELFSGLEISNDPDFKTYLNSFYVIFIDMAHVGGKYHSVDETIQCLKEDILYDIQSALDPEMQSSDLKRSIERQDLSEAIREIYKITGRQFVFIIDEWDYLFRVYPKDQEGGKKFQKWLNMLLKDASYAALVYMTGILPVKTYGSDSILNMFREKSIVNTGDFAPYTGFTEERVREICDKYGSSFENMKLWYDGYTVNGISIYNPNSVMCAVQEKSFESYWTQSSTFEDVKYYISRNLDGLREKVQALLNGIRIEISMRSYSFDLSNFSSSESVLAALVHLGYLTFERSDLSEDSEERKSPPTGYVRIPNLEVREEFEIAMRNDADYANRMEICRRSENLLSATLACDEEAVAKGIEEAHERYSSILKVNDENSLLGVLYNAYYMAQADYVIFNEMPSGKGYADLAFIPKKGVSKPPLIVEMKYDQDAETAIDQIKSRNYHGKLAEGWGEVLLAGINYDKNNRLKPYTCRIEKWNIDD